MKKSRSTPGVGSGSIRIDPTYPLRVVKDEKTEAGVKNVKTEAGVRKGIRLQNILLLQFYAMIPKQGRGTARSTPWAPSPAYDKRKAWDSAGRLDGYDG